MILACLIDEIPDLEVPDADRVGALVMTGVHERLEIDRPRWLGIRRYEGFDFAKRRGNLRLRRCRGRDS